MVPGQKFIRFLSKTKLEPLFNVSTVFSVQRMRKIMILLILQSNVLLIDYMLFTNDGSSSWAWLGFFFSKNENIKVGGSVLLSCLFVKINHSDEKCCDLGCSAKSRVYFQKFLCENYKLFSCSKKWTLCFYAATIMTPIYFLNF